MAEECTRASLQACRQRLAELIRTHALVRGEFTLRSGRTSGYYIDARQVTLHPEGAYLVARLILERVRGSGVTAVGGPTLGADPIVGAVCALGCLEGQPLAGFIVRKEAKDHGMGRSVEGPLARGARVAVVEDTVTTGGELLRAIERVRADFDAEIAKVIVLVDREEGAREALAAAGCDLEAIFTVRELLRDSEQ